MLHLRSSLRLPRPSSLSPSPPGLAAGRPPRRRPGRLDRRRPHERRPPCRSVAVTLEGPPASAGVTTGPEGASAPAGLARRRVRGLGRRPRPRARRARAAAVGPRGGRGAARPRARAGAGARARGRERDPRRGDALDARASPSPSSTASASTSARRPRPARSSQEVPGVAIARAGRAGPPGLGLRPRRRVALRAGARGRRAVNQPGGAFDFGTALPFELERVEVVRGARQQPLRHRRPGGVVSLDDAARAAGRGAVAARRGRGGELRLAARRRPRPRARAAPSTGTSGLQRLTTDNEEPNSALRGDLGRALARAPVSAAGTDARAVVRFDDGTHRHARADGLRPARPATPPSSGRTRSPPPRVRHAGARPHATSCASASRARASSRSNPLDSGAWTPA